METKKSGSGAFGTMLAAVVSLVLLPMVAGAAPTSSFASNTTVDWTAGLIRADVQLDLGAAGINLPSGRSHAERSLESAVPDLVRETALSVQLDSYRTIGESLTDGTLDPALFEAFLEAGRMTRSSLSRDLSKLQESYEWKLADLAALYVRHSVPIDLPPPDRYVPARAYTGIVVYLQGEYGVKGEHRTARIHPCLFPKLFDESMRTIVERNLLYPDALRAWGAVGYATSLGDPTIEARAGSAPLRIIAAEIFGSRRTDVIISNEDALKILGSPENRKLAQEGKVVFIIDTP
jgi:hypothetical protein